MVKHYIIADITTPKGAPRIDYPQGWYENAASILVRAYDDVNHYCYAELEDDALFQKLMGSGRVTVITSDEMEGEVARLRPPPPDVTLVFNREIPAEDKAAIEDIIESKKLTYRTEGKGG